MAKKVRIGFANKAIRDGMDSFSDLYNASFLDEKSTNVLSSNVLEWYNNPNISSDELALFGVDD